MKKALAGGLAVLAVILFATFARPARASGNFDCDESWSLCAEPESSIGYDGEYTGHDEPSLLFYSNRAGSGNSNLYQFRLPKEPRQMPNQAGTGGTWNFQLHPAFWLGMALCDNQSAPEYTHEPCARDSDTNIKDGSDPNAGDYIGKHAGTAFLELQFYPPGWAPWPPGISCDAHKWCAAMAIFSLSNDYNNNVPNNEDCLNTVGIEPVNFAFITLSGMPHAPPSPLGATEDTFTPHASTDLFMNGGDDLLVDIHDTSSGLVTVIYDETTHRFGSMKASTANGFAQVNFEPDAAMCSQSAYAFHPMYSTSSEHTRVPWAAHSYNVAASDEIGHFQYCATIPVEGGPCADPNADDDDDVCFSPAVSLLVQVGGCIASNINFDGTSYLPDWPGTNPNHGQDKKYHAEPVTFTSPLFNYTRNYERVAFEADMPRIEAADFGGTCNRSTGENCVNPPEGAAFYPIFTTGEDHGHGHGHNPRHGHDHGHGHDDCIWQFGGTHIPGTTNTFGGNSTTEFGDLLLSNYPGAGFTPVFRYNNFRRVLNHNPCRA
jgi:hypothetical protein